MSVQAVLQAVKERMAQPHDKTIPLPVLSDPRRKQILYRAMHRGFKEADLLLGNFAAENLATMTDAELAEFEDLLKLSDHDLYNWATGRDEPPANVSGPVFEKLKAYDVAKVTAP